MLHADDDALTRINHSRSTPRHNSSAQQKRAKPQQYARVGRRRRAATRKRGRKTGFSAQSVDANQERMPRPGIQACMLVGWKNSARQHTPIGGRGGAVGRRRR